MTQLLQQVSEGSSGEEQALTKAALENWQRLQEQEGMTSKQQRKAMLRHVANLAPKSAQEVDN